MRHTRLRGRRLSAHHGHAGHGEPRRGGGVEGPAVSQAALRRTAPCTVHRRAGGAGTHMIMLWGTHNTRISQMAGGEGGSGGSARVAMLRVRAPLF